MGYYLKKKVWVKSFIMFSFDIFPFKWPILLKCKGTLGMHIWSWVAMSLNTREILDLMRKQPFKDSSSESGWESTHAFRFICGYKHAYYRASGFYLFIVYHHLKLLNMLLLGQVILSWFFMEWLSIEERKLPRSHTSDSEHEWMMMLLF